MKNLPAPETVKPDTPLRLSVAAQIAFPDGSISISALRRMIVTGKLEAAVLAGRYYVTLKDIGEMIERCRVNRRDPASSSTKGACGLSETDSAPLALAA